MVRNAALIAILLYSLTATSADNPCCSGLNLLTKEKKCAEGELKELSCKEQIMIYANMSEMFVDEKDALVYFEAEDPIPPDQYCLTKLERNNKDILVICNEPDKEENLRIANIILSLISVFFIILTITVYILLPQLLDTQGICLIQSITGLALSYITLGCINLIQMIPHHHCVMVAYLMYFSFLYAFFWLNILCFHIWKMIVNPKILRFTQRWKLIYHVVGISGPLLLLIVVIIANHSGYEFFANVHPGIGEVKCWFKDTTGTFLYFYGPISILLCINIVYFVWTTVVLFKEMKRCSGKRAKVHKYRLLLCIKLFFVMGISWIFEVISAAFENVTPRWVWIISDSLNALQGVLIFLLLVVFRKKVLRALANRKIFNSIRLPAGWKTAQDDECEELEEELSLSAVAEKKGDILS